MTKTSTPLILPEISEKTTEENTLLDKISSKSNQLPNAMDPSATVINAILNFSKSLQVSTSYLVNKFEVNES
jgi:hypothetical protein